MMNLAQVEKVVRAVLYEGYMLYPYRPSAIKNRQRWNFGTLFPPSYSALHGEADTTRTDCLVAAGQEASIDIRVRFLQLRAREVSEVVSGAGVPAQFRIVDSLVAGDRSFHSLQEAAEREIILPPMIIGHLAGGTKVHAVSFPGHTHSEDLRDPHGQLIGKIERRQSGVEAVIEVAAEQLLDRIFRLTVSAHNVTFLDEPAAVAREEALLRSMASTHKIFTVRGGEFVSLMDPPEELAALARSCVNVRTWPVLAGNEGERDCLLSSPIILYDYPQIAPESNFDLFDSTEIDELLTLRVLTLTEDEKREMRNADERSRRILERAEALTSQQIMNLHGADRSPCRFRPGDRVRLKPRAGGDIFDLALAGMTATIESVEQDYEGKIHVAVIVDEDPGKDLGTLRQPGHRFFFSPSEVEILST
jgi:hypothetical protein